MFIYLVGSRTHRWYKIGKADDVNIRLRQIGLLLPFRIELIAVWRAWFSEVERMLHRKYSKNRVNGEWFRFSKKEIEEIITTPIDNATLLPLGSLRFTNIEYKEIPDIRTIVQYILARKVKQALKNYHPGQDSDVDLPTENALVSQRFPNADDAGGDLRAT